jgi:hypothetical protein
VLCWGKGLGPGLFQTLEDFEFRAALTVYNMVQHLHFFEKNSEKYKRNTKHNTKNTKWWN